MLSFSVLLQIMDDGTESRNGWSLVGTRGKGLRSEFEGILDRPKSTLKVNYMIVVSLLALGSTGVSGVCAPENLAPEVCRAAFSDSLLGLPSRTLGEGRTECD